MDDCRTCKEDQDICGTLTSFDYVLDDAGFFQRWKSSFRYTQGGRPTNSVVSWEYFADESCRILINGIPCNGCTTSAACQDGFRGLDIDCGNVLLLEDGPTRYVSCFPETGGVLDIFEWMDTDSWVGCPLIQLREQ